MTDAAATRTSPPTTDIAGLAEHLFRHEAGKLVSVLTGLFGIEKLQLAEDVVQEALVRALKSWPYYGIPKNPAAWLTQTAKNLALDVLRRDQLFQKKQPQIVTFLEQWSESSPEPVGEGEIKDHRLRLMFACCHPAISVESQTALALKTLCGFSPAEIAAAFLTTEVAIAKRLTRARQQIAELKIPFAIPSGNQISLRLDAVLQTLYLLFNEGYKASTGNSLVREELCHEAINLVTLLTTHPLTNTPTVHALAALMLFNASRLSARTDVEGNILRLEEQDRSRWDKSMIVRGMMHLAQSACGSQVSEYHLQAGIAAAHCAVTEGKGADWAQILALYDQLVRIDNSPIVALNRAVAVGKVHGPKAGLEAVQSIDRKHTLESYHLFYAVQAEFEAQLNNFSAASAQLRKALALAELPSERALLEKRLQACEYAGSLALPKQ